MPIGRIELLHLFSKAGFLTLARLLGRIDREGCPPPSACIWDSSPGSFRDYAEFIAGIKDFVDLCVTGIIFLLGGFVTNQMSRWWDIRTNCVGGLHNAAANLSMIASEPAASPSPALIPLACWFRWCHSGVGWP